MSYYETVKKKVVNNVCKRMRDAKANKRDNDKIPCDNFSLYDLPEKRKIVIVITLDFGIKIDVFRFFKTKRINSYFVSLNKNKSEKMGWSVFCKRLSNHYPSLLSPYAL
ncbi:MAG: hypothetical protein KAR42_14785 [candidate division Zixibacteria bacterium]|nr:hypothetical protein [candidate division Zixibacteria bacterium]